MYQMRVIIHGSLTDDDAYFGVLYYRCYSSIIVVLIVPVYMLVQVQYI